MVSNSVQGSGTLGSRGRRRGVPEAPLQGWASGVRHCPLHGETTFALRGRDWSMFLFFLFLLALVAFVQGDKYCALVNFTIFFEYLLQLV